MSTHREIGFIGAGVMGSGMVRSLLRKGHTVRVYNRTRAKAETLVQDGAMLAETAADAAREAKIIITMVADPGALRSVLEGKHGVLAAIQPGSVLIDSSTVSPLVTRQVFEQLAARGADMFDAPV